MPPQKSSDSAVFIALPATPARHPSALMRQVFPIRWTSP